jgi:hypothetical protein
MDDRWQRIEEIYPAAWEQPPEQRAAFLDRGCAGDSALRDEVESQLAVTAGGRLSPFPQFLRFKQ